MIGSTLALVVSKLKAELDSSMTVGTAKDTNYYQLVETKLLWFCAQYDWKHLEDEWRATVALDTEHTAFPTTDNNGNSYTLNFDRPFNVEVQHSDIWQPVDFGIGSEEYNTYDSAARVMPIEKWDYRQGDRSQFRTWPIGSAEQSIRISGQRNPITLRSGGNFSAAALVDLDDLLLVYTIAAELLSSKPDGSAGVKAGLAQARFLSLRSNEPTRNDGPVSLNPNYNQQIKRRPMRVLAA